MLPITARVAWITPSTLTWRMRATCSRSYVSSVPCQLTPALFTKMVTGPSSASVWATIASTAAESATSAATAIARPPAVVISATRASAASACTA
jgi:hypothetical protein